MPGPNSAPNGDRRLVVGYDENNYVLIEVTKGKLKWVLARSIYSTGKTDKKRS